MAIAVLKNGMTNSWNINSYFWQIWTNAK